MPILLPNRMPPSHENRHAAAKALGLPLGLVNALIAGQDVPRYGRSGLRHESLAKLRESVPESGQVPMEIVLRGMQFSIALDLDDPFVGHDVLIMHQIDSDGSDLWSVDLSPNCILQTAIRTGLYLPGRTQVKKDAQWIATATCFTRVDVSATSWVESSCFATYEHFFEREADQRSPTVEWEMDPDLHLQKVAMVLASMRALTPLLDGLPCRFASFKHLESEDYTERKAKILERRAVAEAGGPPA